MMYWRKIYGLYHILSHGVHGRYNPCIILQYIHRKYATNCILFSFLYIKSRVAFLDDLCFIKRFSQDQLILSWIIRGPHYRHRIALIATGETKQKYSIFVCTLKQISSVGYTMHNNWLKPVRIPLSAVKWFDMRFDRSLHAWHCVRQVPNLFKVQTKYAVRFCEIRSLINISGYHKFNLVSNLTSTSQCGEVKCFPSLYIFLNGLVLKSFSPLRLGSVHPVNVFRTFNEVRLKQEFHSKQCLITNWAFWWINND